MFYNKALWAAILLWKVLYIYKVLLTYLKWQKPSLKKMDFVWLMYHPQTWRGQDLYCSQPPGDQDILASSLRGCYWLFINPKNTKNALTFLRRTFLRRTFLTSVLRENGLERLRGRRTWWDVCSCNDFWEIRCVLAGQVTNRRILDKRGGQEHFRVFLTFLVTCVLWIGTVLGNEIWRKMSSQEHKNGEKRGLINSQC